MRLAPVLVAIVSFARAADAPVTLVSEDEAEPIHSAILRGEAWTQDSVRRLRLEADRRMKEGPWSVTFDRPKAPGLDPHEYYSESPTWWPDPINPGGPYIRRDVANPDRFMANRTALNSMCDAVFTLGSASFLLDEPRYAQRAARLIQTWFINPKTRMNPSLDHAQSIPGPPPAPGATAASWGFPALDGRPLIRAIQGMDFMAQEGGWDAKDLAAVHRWFEDYLRWLGQNGPGPGKGTGGERAWWAAQMAAVATFVEDDAAAKRAFAYYRDRIFPREIRAEAAAGRGDPRRAPEFFAADLDGVSMVCRIAQVHGVDLWSARSRSGATIAAVIDALQPALADPKRAREVLAGVEPGGAYFLAFAGMGLNRPDYVALYGKLEHHESAWLAFVDLLVGRWEAAAHQTRH